MAHTRLTRLPRATRIVVVSALLLCLSAQSASATWFNMEQALPGAGLRVRVFENGEMGVSLEENDRVVLGTGADGVGSGSPTGGGTSNSHLMFRVDNTSYMTNGGTGNPHYRDITSVDFDVLSPRSTSSRFVVTPPGADAGFEILVNHTLVRNATRVDLRITNLDPAGAHDFGFRQTLDTFLEGSSVSEDAPFLRAPNTVGDFPGNPGVWRDKEHAFEDVPFQHLRLWQAVDGPDGPRDTKAVVWFDPAWGGTQPDRVVFSASRAAAWDYVATQSSVTINNFLLVYWGYDNPWTIPSGETRTLTFWYGRDVPSKVQTYRLDGSLDSNGPGAGSRTARFTAIEPGETVYFPFTIHQNGTLVGQDKTERVRLSVEGAPLPPGWSAQAVAKTSNAPLPSVVALETGQSLSGRIRIVSAPDAPGEETAVIRLRASVDGDPPDADPLRDRPFVELRAMATIKPETGLGITVIDDPLLNLDPGETGEAKFLLTNDGNLRDPLRVFLEALTSLNEPWSFQFDPGFFVPVEAGGSKIVTLKITPSDDAAPGLSDILVQGTAQRTSEVVAASIQVKVREGGRLGLVGDPLPLAITAGGSRVFPITIANNGEDPADFRVEVVPDLQPGWNVTHTVSGVGPKGLAPGARGTIMVEVTAPTEAAAGTRFEVGVVLRDATGTRQLASTTVAALVDRDITFRAELQNPVIAVRPGDDEAAQVRVHNEGNGVIRVAAVPLDVPDGVEVRRDADVLTLSPGATGHINVTFTALPEAHAGTYATALRVRNVGNATAAPVEQALNLTIEERRVASVAWERIHHTVRPGGTVVLRGLLANLGNVNDTVTFTGAPSGWTIDTGGGVSVAAGARVAVQVRLGLPANASLESHDVDLRAVSASGAPFNGTLPAHTVTVAAPDVSIGAVTVDKDTILDGRLGAATVSVTNRGNGPTGTFEVALFVDAHEVLPRGIVDGLGPDQTATLRLTWAAPDGAYTIRVVADPDGTTGDANPDDNERAADVDPRSLWAATLQEAPAPSLVPFTALLVATLMLAKRRHRA